MKETPEANELLSKMKVFSETLKETNRAEADKLLSEMKVFSETLKETDRAIADKLLSEMKAFSEAVKTRANINKSSPVTASPSTRLPPTPINVETMESLPGFTIDPHAPGAVRTHAPGKVSGEEKKKSISEGYSSKPKSKPFWKNFTNFGFRPTTSKNNQTNLPAGMKDISNRSPLAYKPVFSDSMSFEGMPFLPPGSATTKQTMEMGDNTLEQTLKGQTEKTPAQLIVEAFHRNQTRQEKTLEVAPPTVSMSQEIPTLKQFSAQKEVTVEKASTLPASPLSATIEQFPEILDKKPTLSELNENNNALDKTLAEMRAKERELEAKLQLSEMEKQSAALDKKIEAAENALKEKAARLKENQSEIKAPSVSRPKFTPIDSTKPQLPEENPRRIVEAAKSLKEITEKQKGNEQQKTNSKDLASATKLLSKVRKRGANVLNTGAMMYKVASRATIIRAATQMIKRLAKAHIAKDNLAAANASNQFLKTVFKVEPQEIAKQQSAATAPTNVEKTPEVAADTIKVAAKTTQSSPTPGLKSAMKKPKTADALERTAQEQPEKKTVTFNEARHTIEPDRYAIDQYREMQQQFKEVYNQIRNNPFRVKALNELWQQAKQEIANLQEKFPNDPGAEFAHAESLAERMIKQARAQVPAAQYLSQGTEQTSHQDKKPPEIPNNTAASQANDEGVTQLAPKVALQRTPRVVTVSAEFRNAWKALELPNHTDKWKELAQEHNRLKATGDRTSAKDFLKDQVDAIKEDYKKVMAERLANTASNGRSNSNGIGR